MHQLGIEAARLASGAVQPETGIEVGMSDHELSLHRRAAQQIEKEGLAGTEFADDKAKAGAAIGDAVEVFV